MMNVPNEQQQKAPMCCVVVFFLFISFLLYLIIARKVFVGRQLGISAGWDIPTSSGEFLYAIRRQMEKLLTVANKMFGSDTVNIAQIHCNHLNFYIPSSKSN